MMLDQKTKEYIKDLVATGDLDNLDSVYEKIYEEVKEVVKEEAVEQGLKLVETDRVYYVIPMLKVVK